MRSTETKMETAIDVPRLRAVPAPADAPDLDPSDETLLLRVADSDREAFELLYHRYVRSVLGQALRKLNDRAQAEEVVQEAFTAVWRSASSYRPERGSAGGWLYTIARNATVDRMRRNGRADTTSELPELPSLESGPYERVEQSDEVTDEMEDGVLIDRLGPVALAVTAHVRGNGMEARLSQCNDLVTPGVPAFRKAVAQQNKRALALLNDIQADAVGLDDPLDRFAHGPRLPKCDRQFSLRAYSPRPHGRIAVSLGTTVSSILFSRNAASILLETKPPQPTSNVHGGALAA